MDMKYFDIINIESIESNFTQSEKDPETITSFVFDKYMQGNVDVSRRTIKNSSFGNKWTHIHSRVLQPNMKIKYFENRQWFIKIKSGNFKPLQRQEHEPMKEK